MGGYLGILPAGGVTWDYIQYPLGLAEMGHDVYYIEDTRLYPMYQPAGSAWDDCSSCVQHLSQVMKYFGLADRWAYRDEASGRCFGLSEQQVVEICHTADVFINVSCSTYMRNEYLRIPLRILIDSDPMFTQIQYVTGQGFTPGESGIRRLVHQHNRHFSFGEAIGSADSRVPTSGIDWQPTRQPICLDHWPLTPQPALSEAAFTTLMNWSAGKVLHYAGAEWGQKDLEFPKILTLPTDFPDIRFAIVVSKTGQTAQHLPAQEITAQGWHILDPQRVANDWVAYRQFINRSWAELSIAKQTYVQGRTGWFSCRSACYLAAGRPVITQDTGWTNTLPSGQGLLGFTDTESAGAAVDSLLSQPEQHHRAARSLAEEYFDSRKVLTCLLERAMATPPSPVSHHH